MFGMLEVTCSHERVRSSMAGSCANRSGSCHRVRRRPVSSRGGFVIVAQTHESFGQRARSGALGLAEARQSSHRCDRV